MRLVKRTAVIFLFLIGIGSFGWAQQYVILTFAITPGMSQELPETVRHVPAAIYQVVHEHPFGRYRDDHGHKQAGHKQVAGTLTVADTTVRYLEPGEQAQDFSLPCSSFLEQALLRNTTDRSGKRVNALYVGGKYLLDHFSDRNDGSASFASIESVYKGINTECRAHLQKEAEAFQATRRAMAAMEEADAKRLAEIQRQRDADFRDAVLKAWRAARDPEPFQTIRAEYDLASSDNRHWKTSLSIPDAEDCFLLRNSAITKPNQSWTYTCRFSGPGATYEHLVKAVQTSLSMTYQPDEASTGANQVFFQDPANPDWRLVITKIVSPSMVAMRIGAGQQASGPVPDLPPQSQPSRSVSIRDEIDAVERRPHTALPTPTFHSNVVAPGTTVLNVQNDTGYTLTVLFSGPVEDRVEVAAHSSTSVSLVTGTYKVVGRVNSPDVLPSYGEHQLIGEASINFYVQ